MNKVRTDSMPKMTEEEVRRFRNAVLNMVAEGDGKTRAEIMAHPSIREFTSIYAQTTIMSMVQGLRKAGLIERYGQTRDAIYFITDEGKETLRKEQGNS